MGWFSNLQRLLAETATSGRRGAGADADADANFSADNVQQARVRSRRRLIGAVVLVVIGVIGFPLVFETQPRPIPVDIPIEIPRKEGLAPLVMPAAKPTVALQAPLPATSASTASTASTAPNLIKPTAPQAVEEVIAPGRPPAAVSSLPVLPALPVASDGDRAKALLEGKPVVKAGAAKTEGSKLELSKPELPKDAGRFVVQVGAFAENDAARSTRLKVEKLGLKTYVQVAETPAGKRIRVRVGPYTSKEEAEQAKTKLTAGGFPAVLLVL